MNFLHDLDGLLPQVRPTLKETTLSNKVTFLTTHALDVQGGMSPALVAETKQHIGAMQSGCNITVPITVSQSIG